MLEKCILTVVLYGTLGQKWSTASRDICYISNVPEYTKMSNKYKTFDLCFGPYN
jgi:hypothetical protein